MSRGETTWNEHVRLLVERRGYPEETYFTWSYSPIRDGSGRIGGLFCAVTEETERVRAEAALRQSEGRHRLLFESMDEGFCVIEVLFDHGGKAVDYRFLEVNPAFEQQTGITGAVGRRMREIAPQHEDHWFETYGRVVRTGEPVRFEQRAEA